MNEMTGACPTDSIHTRKYYSSFFRHLIFFLTLPFFALPKLSANPPNAVFGFYGEGLVIPDGSSDAGLTGNLELAGFFNWRHAITSGGYIFLNASASLNDYLDDVAAFNDGETLCLEVGLPLSSAARLTGSVGTSSSFLGTASAPSFLRPDWSAEMLFGDENQTVRPFLSYEGYYLYQPTDIEDALFQGGLAGLVIQPGILNRYRISVGGGWEGWFDYPLYDSGGNDTGDMRNDALLKVQAEADGILGYFGNYRIIIASDIRFSNSNRYVSSNSRLEENSESRVVLTEKADLGWSPKRQLNLQWGVRARQDLYFAREALDRNGFLTGEALNVLFFGGSFQIDYTPNDRLYFIVGTSGGFSLSNDPDEKDWSFIMRAGIEFSL